MKWQAKNKLDFYLYNTYTITIPIMDIPTPNYSGLMLVDSGYDNVYGIYN